MLGDALALAGGRLGLGHHESARCDQPKDSQSDNGPSSGQPSSFAGSSGSGPSSREPSR